MPSMPNLRLINLYKFLEVEVIILSRIIPVLLSILLKVATHRMGVDSEDLAEVMEVVLEDQVEDWIQRC